jgi:hypothetical protein
MLQRITGDIDCGALARHLLRGGFTTKELGAKIGLAQPSVSRLATGKTKVVSSTVALNLIRLAGGQVLMPPVEHPGNSGGERVSLFGGGQVAG